MGRAVDFHWLWNCHRFQVNYAQIGGNVKGVLDVVWCTQILVRIFLRKSFVVSIRFSRGVYTNPPTYPQG